MEFKAEREAYGQRIDKYLTERIDKTRSAISILIENGRVTVNNVVISKNYKVKENDCILIDYPDPVPL